MAEKESSERKKGLVMLASVAIIVGVFAILCVYPMIFKPDVHANIMGANNYFNQATVEFQIYNQGTGDAQNVKVDVGVFRDEGKEFLNRMAWTRQTPIVSQTVYIGQLKPGQSRTEKISLTGDIPENCFVSIKILQ